MSNKKQTAVEWLEEKLIESGVNLLRDEIELIQQAKELEKQQIKESFYFSYKKGYNVGHADAESHPFALTIADNIHKDFEQYYKETYEEGTN